MSEIAPIFRDTELQLQFEGDGYVKIKLLDIPEARELYNYYVDNQKEHDIIDGLYHSTTHSNNFDLILKIDRKLKAVLLPKLVAIFRDYEPMMCTYITKQPGEGSETKLHQDPTFVDESKYVSANIWIALHDINHENGNLFFVKGTNHIMPSLRVTPDCPGAYDKVKDLLLENLTEVPVNVGEAIVINHATMHGATPNLASHQRIAAVLAIRSAKSSWIYHYLEPGAAHDKIEKYSVNLDTFMHLKRDGRPAKADFLGYIHSDFPQIDRKDFITRLNAGKNKGSTPSWLHKLSAIKEKMFL